MSLAPAVSPARFPAAVVPTARAALALVLAAPVALVIAAASPAAWIVAPLGALVLLALIFADALAAGRLADFSIAAAPDGEVGAPHAVRASARFARGRPRGAELAMACDPRLSDGGRLAFALAPAEGAWQGGAQVRPARRGAARIDRAWLRWTGPLGLGARQACADVGQEVRIWPNVAALRSPAMQTFLRESQYGLIARRMRGEGTQFEALAEYEPGMDRRRIDWKSSARHARLLAREYEAERNNQIVFAFDCGRAMCEPVAGMPRLDRAVSAALAASYVALRGGDRVAVYGFAGRPTVSSPFVSGSGEFHRLQRAAAGLDYTTQEPNFTLGLATLAGRLQRRSLVVVFSEFSDPTGAELMIESIARLLSRHVVLFVTLVDEELETLSGAAPADLEALSMAVSAEQLLRQRALVTRRLRQLGVDVIEAPHAAVGPRLIDAYLAAKRSGAIG